MAVKNFLESITRRSRKVLIENEVDEELHFHIDMQTSDYELRGITPEESRVMAEARFGDVERIKSECISISTGNTFLTWVLTFVFLMSLIVGLLVRALSPEMHVTRVGDVMMMIGGLGILLVYAKRAGSMGFTKSSSVRLGLNNSPPASFDEEGRTPFERVKSL